jgi:23S rRNA pseudouridine2605 synthase
LKQRLQKILAQRGLASRREAERMILDGRVTVNGSLVSVLGTQADPDADDIRVDGKLVPPVQAARVLMLNKPPGYVSTCKTGREIGRSVLELVPHDRRYFPVGRLDRDSSGLLLLTDDGDLAHRLMHPRHKVAKLYLVTCDASLPRGGARRLEAGIPLEDGVARALRVSALGDGLYRVVLGEGRKRQIRRMFRALGVRVTHLQRVQVGGVELGDLAEGRWRELTAVEIQALLSPDAMHSTQ